MNREFTRDERIAANDFIMSQTVRQNDFLRDQAQFEADLKETLQTNQLNAEQKRFAEEMALKNTIFEAQQDQFEKEFTESVKANTVNGITALKNSGYTDQQIQALLGELGFDEGMVAALSDPAFQPAPPSRRKKDRSFMNQWKESIKAGIGSLAVGGGITGGGLIHTAGEAVGVDWDDFKGKVRNEFSKVGKAITGGIGISSPQIAPKISAPKFRF